MITSRRSFMIGTIYWTLMIGFMTGALVKFFVPQLRDGDLFTTMTIGLVGSVLFGWMGGALKLYPYGDNLGLIASFLGSCILLAAYYIYRLKHKPKTF
jgi:uncharacterized membrane protein YeaQ/YmgE (transglycosylase-associated protein family)